jgi:hypothetical protein
VTKISLGSSQGQRLKNASDFATTSLSLQEMDRAPIELNHLKDWGPHADLVQDKVLSVTWDKLSDNVKAQLTSYKELAITKHPNSDQYNILGQSNAISPDSWAKHLQDILKMIGVCAKLNKLEPKDVSLDMICYDQANIQDFLTLLMMRAHVKGKVINYKNLADITMGIIKLGQWLKVDMGILDFEGGLTPEDEAIISSIQYKLEGLLGSLRGRVGQSQVSYTCCILLTACLHSLWECVETHTTATSPLCSHTGATAGDQAQGG